MSDAGSINKIIAEPNAKKYVKYTPLFKARRGSDESKGAAPCARRIAQVLGALVLLALFVVGVLGAVVMWTTSMFDDLINDRLVLRNGSAAFEAWRRSPVKPIMRFRFFNYSNAEAFRRGDDDRLRVDEVGPYAFIETTERVNIVFHDNGSITYQDRKTYEFVPELTEGSLNDTIITLNVPLLTLNFQMRKSNYFQRLPVAATLRLVAPPPFHARTANELFWGYEDTLTKLASIKVKDVKVGILQQKNGTSRDAVTIQSGAGNLRLLGQISHYAGRDHVDYYPTSECNRVDGSDGTKFPPPAVRPGGRLVIYHRDVCRRVPLDAHEYVTVFGDVPAIRFRPPPNLLDDGTDNPDNACYCVADSMDVCPPSGVMGTAHCKDNAPVFVSLPHFLRGDEALRDAVDGLRPDARLHDIYLDIHERMGVPVAGRTRFQFNVLVRDTFNNYILKRLDEKVLPFVWLERELGEFPPEVQALLRAASLTLPKVRSALRWGTLALAAAAGAALALWAAVALCRMLRQPLSPPETYVMSRL